MMLFKVLILDADHGLLENLRDLIALEVIRILFRQCFRDQVVIRIINLARLRRDKRLFAALGDQLVRLVLHGLYSSVVSAKIEHAQPCQDAHKYQEQQHF